MRKKLVLLYVTNTLMKRRFRISGRSPVKALLELKTGAETESAVTWWGYKAQMRNKKTKEIIFLLMGIMWRV
jgi:hypothetical protein